MWMRGGTSKGGIFLADDLPSDRDAFLLRIMGSPDIRQIDGMGGGDPLSSKVAVVRASARPGVDVEYLFLQVALAEALVSDGQNCGNMLAAVAPFAIERGLVPACDGETPVVIHMQNTGQKAVAMVQTPGGRVTYEGCAEIDGVPGRAAPVAIEFCDSAGSTCGALLPTGRAQDLVGGLAVTMVDGGMPCVILRAADMGLRGDETPKDLEANEALRARLEAIRLACGPLMNLGDVAKKTIPKMVLISAPRGGGAISTRTFIPHVCHRAIGVLAAVSVATACLLPDSVAAGLAQAGRGGARKLGIEHPSGKMLVLASLDHDGRVARAAILRTARKLMDGLVYG